MFSIAQISAVIGLLLAFGVSQPNVEKVQSILQDTGTQAQVATTTSSISINVTPTQSQQLQVAPQIQFGATPTPQVAQTTPVDCSSTLQGQVVNDQGDYMFYGTTTPTAECPIDPSTKITIQFPQRTSTPNSDSGTLGDWMRNSGTDVYGNVTGGIIKKGNAYLFAQGWGYGRGETLLTNTFIWTVGNSSITVTLPQ